MTCMQVWCRGEEERCQHAAAASASRHARVGTHTRARGDVDCCNCWCSSLLSALCFFLSVCCLGLAPPCPPRKRQSINGWGVTPPSSNPQAPSSVLKQKTPQAVTSGGLVRYWPPPAAPPALRSRIAPLSPFPGGRRCTAVGRAYTPQHWQPVDREKESTANPLVALEPRLCSAAAFSSPLPPCLPHLGAEFRQRLAARHSLFAACERYRSCVCSCVAYPCKPVCLHG